MIRRGRAKGAALAAAAMGAAWLALAGPARAEPQLEPVARLQVEGGYDSNALYDGRGDRRARISPELGLHLFDHLWDAVATYGGDWIGYGRGAAGGLWNHRGVLALEATPTHRQALRGGLRAGYAFDPLGLAYAGVFRAGRQSALLVQANGRADEALTERLGLGLTLTERLVRFQDRTGGAMHAPGAELLWQVDERLSLGGAYAFSVFQDFRPGGSDVAFANGARARLRYLVTRSLEADAFAGPALWSGPKGRAVVPELGGELRLSTRAWDLRLSGGHQLGIGSTAAPGLVDSTEIGAVRRFGQRFDLRGDGGIWRSGTIPTGRGATVGYAVSGEAGWHVTRSLRAAVAAAHLARLDDRSPALARTTIGVRLGWELRNR